MFSGDALDSLAQGLLCPSQGSPGLVYECATRLKTVTAHGKGLGKEGVSTREVFSIFMPSNHTLLVCRTLSVSSSLTELSGIQTTTTVLTALWVTGACPTALILVKDFPDLPGEEPLGAESLLCMFPPQFSLVYVPTDVKPRIEAKTTCKFTQLIVKTGTVPARSSLSLQDFIYCFLACSSLPILVLL